MLSDSATVDWIEEAKRGDELALEALIRAHQGIIRTLANRLHCQWETWEELIQAGNFGFIQAIAHYDASRNIKLITYAVPWILGEMRKAIRRKEMYSLDQPMEAEGQTLHDVLAGDLDVDICRIDLRLAISRLNPDEQMLILLRYYRDNTQRETALLLGKSQTQVSRLERRALDALHILLS